MVEKPACKLIGTDGNIFALGSKVRKTLHQAGLVEREQEFSRRLFDCKSYSEALSLIMEFVEVS